MRLNRIRNPAVDDGFWDNHRERTARIVEAVRARRRRGKLQKEWAWVQTIGVPYMPWCKECGVIVPVGAGQLAHEQNVHGVGDEAELDEIDDAGDQPAITEG
jgi:hypothetical protein